MPMSGGLYMGSGFIIVMVVMCAVIVWISIWVTNKAYARKPDVVDPIETNQNKWDDKRE